MKKSHGYTKKSAVDTQKLAVTIENANIKKDRITESIQRLLKKQQDENTNTDT